MKITNLSIENFRGISYLNITDLEDIVVIAGPNGCGKSTVFDAIRLWKSGYAGYQEEEIQWWLQELGLGNVQNAFAKLLQDPTKPMIIEASIKLAEKEKEWLAQNGESLIRNSAIRRLIPGSARQGMDTFSFGGGSFNNLSLIEAISSREGDIRDIVNAELPTFLDQLRQRELSGRLTCYSDGRAETANSIALAQIFSVYDGINVGIIDYHGPQRSFAREDVGGISLQIDQYKNQRKQSALYNNASKYTSVKQELASAYVRDLVATSANGPSSGIGLGLAETLEELFIHFFPGKRFRGVEPVGDGSIKFEVETPVGRHDINDLSSGEKELLYGYLRLRNYAPRSSIILLDEPELHLNPRLTDGLIDFYHRHIGVALDNQLWLVTHSDMILRQSVGRPGYKVFHMLTAGSPLSQSGQALEIRVDKDVERAIVDIIGDLAAYKPGAKLVFIEGGGRSPFDERALNELFPEFCDAVNLISAGSRSRVEKMSDLFNEARRAGAAIDIAYSITDWDQDPEPTTSEFLFRWDRYHIENYLLDPEIVGAVAVDLGLGGKLDTHHNSILMLLKDRAAETLGDLVRHELERITQKKLSSAIKTGISREQSFDKSLVITALEGVRERIDGMLAGDLSEAALGEAEKEIRGRLQDDLDSGRWVSTFRGRDILKKFLAVNLNGITRYEPFRDLLLAKMRDRKVRPDGIESVLKKIITT